MKKTLMILAAVMVFTSANAQDEKWYGSKEGGFAITFNADPVLNYAGNLFNGTQNNKLQEFNGVDGWFQGTTITGKYFLKDNLALDLGFGFNNNYNVTNRYNAEDKEKVTGFERKTGTNFAIKVGAEYRLFPGKRIQPIFGADIIFKHDNDWTFNKFEDKDAEKAAGVAGADGETNTTYYGNPSNTLGLMLSSGVEFFIIPQISLGANLNFSFGKTWERKSQNIDPEPATNKDYTRIEVKTTKLRTANLGANVSLNFYF